MNISNDISHRIMYRYDELSSMWIPYCCECSSDEILFSDKTNIKQQLSLIQKVENDFKQTIIAEINSVIGKLPSTATWEDIASIIENVSNNIDTSYLYNYTGGVQEFTAPITGNYRIECVGAGGSSNGSLAKAEIKLNYGAKLYVYVGQRYGSFNGGGSPSSASSNGANASVTYGSGASDVRIIKGNWNDSSSLASRLIVGGGGSGYGSYNSAGQGVHYETDEHGYQHCYRHDVDSSTHYAYGSNSENSNGVLGSGSNSGCGVSTNHHHGDSIFGDENATSYDAWVSLAGGGGWYGGSSGRTGTSYVNNGYSYGGITYNFNNIEYNKCSNNGEGYVKITLIG